MRQSLSEILKIRKLKDALAGYVRVKIELLKLELTEHIAAILAQVVAYFILFNIGMFVIAFASVATANGLNSLLDSEQAGYWIISGVYMIILLITLIYFKSGILRKNIEHKINSEASILNKSETDE